MAKPFPRPEPPAQFSYDRVAYDTEANPDAHPRSLATALALHGRQTPFSAARPLASCRVLDLGCGSGAHLASAASYLPNATFVGVDLATTAIAEGRAQLERSHLANVRLEVRDLLHFDLDPEARGSFDVAVAHGMLSWVPAAVRERMLQTMAEALAPGGIGFLSFNALPGWESRRALRILARERGKGATDPKTRVERALEALGDLASLPPGDAGSEHLAESARAFLRHVDDVTPNGSPFPRYVFHDLIADINDPFSIDSVVALAARFELDAVCEVPVRAKAPQAPSNQAFAQIALVRRVRGEAPPLRWPDTHLAPQTLLDLVVRADWTPLGSGRFRTSNGTVVTATSSASRSFFEGLSGAPGFVPFAAVIDPGTVDASLARDLLALVVEGCLEVFTEPPPCSLVPTPGATVSSFVHAALADAIACGANEVRIVSAFHRTHVAHQEDLRRLALLARYGSDPAVAETAVSRLRSEPEGDKAIARFARLGFLLP